MAKVNGGGNWMWVKQAGGIGADAGCAIALDSEGFAYVTGSFQSNVVFGPSTLTSSGADDIFIAKLGSGTGMDDNTIQLPLSGFQVRNFPNPFNLGTTISYNITTKGLVCLEIYNSKGQLIKSLLHESQAKGEHILTWNGRDNSGHNVASGLYFCRITSAGKQESRKLLLLK